MSQFDKLVAIMARLRAKDGCPWDLKQTHDTLKPYIVEEAHELLSAIDEGDDVEICDELGDVLLQVVFHAQLGYERGSFTIDDVADAIVQKLIRRHPHIFGDVQIDGADEVLKNWEAIKSREKRDKGRDDSLLSSLPGSLPALFRARRLQEKAAKVGFDWEHTHEVEAKVREEVEEFLTARSSGDVASTEEEFGDLLFALVNLARYLDVCPEEALRKTNIKFQDRFAYIEQKLKKQGKDPASATLAEMDALWEEAKAPPSGSD
jgi:tetrapyrrole methylase family protein / MazG family protein